MKKLSFVLGFVALMAFTTTSCKKDYTCSCTVAGMEQSMEYKDSKKGDAEDACDKAESTYKMADPEASCSLD